MVTNRSDQTTGLGPNDHHQDVSTEHPEGRYNAWTYREPIVFPGGPTDWWALVSQADGTSDVPIERDVAFQQMATGSSGVEFVAFSRTKLSEAIVLPRSVSLVPCFYPSLEGKSLADPVTKASHEMGNRRRYVYDGWLPWSDWTSAGVSEAVHTINAALSFPAAFGLAPFRWIPKYQLEDEGNREVFHPGKDWHAEVRRFVEALDNLHPRDREALLRSIGWMAASEHATQGAASFLLSFVALESLATYCTKTAAVDSPMSALAPSRRPPAIRRMERESCIQKKLDEAEAGALTKAISDAYFECIVGIKKNLAEHLGIVFGVDSHEADLLFRSTGDIPSLWDIRNSIAHGNLHALRPRDLHVVEARLADIQQLVRRYFLQVVSKCGDFDPAPQRVEASMRMSMHNGAISSREMYRGPTEMAVLFLGYVF